MPKSAWAFLIVLAVATALFFGLASSSVEQFSRTVRRVTYAYISKFGKPPQSYTELIGSLDPEIGESIDVERRYLRAQLSFSETDGAVFITVRRRWLPPSTVMIKKPFDRKVAAKAEQLFYPKKGPNSEFPEPSPPAPSP